MLATACPHICVSPRSHHELGQKSTPCELQLYSCSSSHAGGGEAGLAVGALSLKVETTWGPQHASRSPPPTELLASDAAPQHRSPQPVLASIWDCGAHLVLGRRKGAGGALSKPTGPV